MNHSSIVEVVGMDKYEEILFELGGCKVKLAKEEHAQYIAKNMRAIDVLECKAVGHTAAEAVMIGFDWDDITLTGFDPKGNPMCIMGSGCNVIPYIWLLGTDEVENNSYVFLKLSRKIAKFLLKKHKRASNFIHKDNLVSRRWLTFCKAEFLKEIMFNEQPFYEFIIKYENV